MLLDEEWIKIDLHIHTLDDPKDALDYSAHEFLDRARTLGFASWQSPSMMRSLIAQRFSPTRQIWEFS